MLDIIYLTSNKHVLTVSWNTKSTRAPWFVQYCFQVMFYLQSYNTWASLKEAIK